MDLTDLCITFPASIFTVQYRGLHHQRALRTLGHPGLTQEKARERSKRNRKKKMNRKEKKILAGVRAS